MAPKAATKGSKAAKEAEKMAALQVADYLEKDALILTPGQAAGDVVFSFVRFHLSVGGCFRLRKYTIP